jgi:hypothetical protein
MPLGSSIIGGNQKRRVVVGQHEAACLDELAGVNHQSVGMPSHFRFSLPPPFWPEAKAPQFPVTMPSLCSILLLWWTKSLNQIHVLVLFIQLRLAVQAHWCCVISLVEPSVVAYYRFSYMESEARVIRRGYRAIMRRGMVEGGGRIQRSFLHLWGLSAMPFPLCY